MITGRWFTDNDSTEKWGTMMWLGGESGAGKSIMAEVNSDNVPDDEFVALNPVGQKDFGREDLFDDDGNQRFMQMLETNSRSNVPQHEMKEMSTGGKVTFTRKYLHGLRVPEYKKRLWLCGNTVPPFVDTSFDIIRRILAFIMNFPVLAKDGLMQERIRMFEAPEILYTQCQCYKFAKFLWGACDLNDRDIYSPTNDFILPPTLRKWKADMIDKFNAPMCFLHNLNAADQPMVMDTRLDVDLNDRMFVSYGDFVKQFKRFREQRFGHEQCTTQVNKDTFSSVFTHMGIETKEMTRMYRGKDQFEHFIIGIGFRDDPCNSDAIAQIMTQRSDSESSEEAAAELDMIGMERRVGCVSSSSSEEVVDSNSSIHEKQFAIALDAVASMCASGQATLTADHIKRLFMAANVPFTSEVATKLLCEQCP